MPKSARHPKSTNGNDTASRLRRSVSKIMKRWEGRVRRKLESAEFQDQSALRNTIPGILESIADTVEAGPKALRLIETSGISREHGGQRSSLPLYRYQDVILEYRFLQQATFEVLEEEGPVPSEDREVIRDAMLVCVTDSVSEFLRVHQDLRQHFFLTLMHDVRAPLTAIKASAQLIVRHPDRDGNHGRQGHRIAENADRIDRMISDLLDASRIQFGERLVMDLSETDLGVLADEVIQELSTVYGDRFKLQADPSIIGFWNPEALRRSIENLCTNAVKYGFKDTPILVAVTKSLDRVKIRVHNAGNPLNPQEMARLFEPFKRADNPGARGQKGWGLGLTLVRGVAEAHGGVAHVESPPGVGTIFSMDLPLDSRPFQRESGSKPD